ncbi:MAG: 6-phosphofructokinase [Bacilli bacterium]|nr:6-phosphofructokinase [Bacilli bacterium]
MKNMVYIQSGGPTSVINTSLYGAIKEARRHPDEILNIYGSVHGVEGLIDDELIDINKEDDEQIELLLQTPGSILGTTRRKLPKDIHDPVYLKIMDNIRKHNIGYVLVNGGNDSMDTCYKLSLLAKDLGVDVKVMGVPKTIDNDLACTDHSLGFPSAAKYVINTINAIVKDAQCFKVGKVHIIEIMGRNAGWLTASVDLLPEDTRPHLIYLPENDFDLNQFLHDVMKVREEHGYAIVAISEGINIKRENANVRVDGFGHAQLGGAAAYLCEVVEEKLGLPTRSVEFSLLQRACPTFVSKVDQEEAIKTGEIAVEKALEGHTGEMIIFKRVKQNPYTIEYSLADLSHIANAEARVPDEYQYDITRMSDAFREYLKPLIQGQIDIKYQDGIAQVAKFKYVRVK